MQSGMMPDMMQPGMMPGGSMGSNGQKTYKVDQDKELYLNHFCSPDDRRALLTELKHRELLRPVGVEARLEHAQDMRFRGKEWFKVQEYRIALVHYLGAVYALDFSINEQLRHKPDHQRQIAESMLRTISSVCMVLLLRGQYDSAEQAADAGLLCAKTQPIQDSALATVRMVIKNVDRDLLAKDSVALSALRKSIKEAVASELGDGLKAKHVTLVDGFMSAPPPPSSWWSWLLPNGPRLPDEFVKVTINPPAGLTTSMLLKKLQDLSIGDAIARTVGNAQGGSLNGDRATATRVNISTTVDCSRAWLLYRRALARGEPNHPERNLEGAFQDLQEAAKLEPQIMEIRTCLQNCKELVMKERADNNAASKKQFDFAASLSGGDPRVKEADSDSGRKEAFDCAAAMTAGDPRVKEADSDSGRKEDFDFAAAMTAGDPRVKEADSDSGRTQRESAMPKPSVELSPTQLMIAKIVGTFLGRSRRYGRQAATRVKHAMKSLWRVAGEPLKPLQRILCQVAKDKDSSEAKTC